MVRVNTVNVRFVSCVSGIFLTFQRYNFAIIFVFRQSFENVFIFSPEVAKLELWMS